MLKVAWFLITIHAWVTAVCGYLAYICCDILN